MAYIKRIAMSILKAKINAIIYAFYVDNNKSRYYVNLNNKQLPEEI
jgi:hypothetical protein